MKRKVESKKTVSGKKIAGSPGKGGKNISPEESTFQVVFTEENPTKLKFVPVSAEQSKNSCKKRGQTKNAYKKQSKVEQTVKAETSQPSKASLTKRGQNKRNAKTQRTKSSKRQNEDQNKKTEASICNYKLPIVAVLKQAELIKKMNKNAIEKAEKLNSTYKFCRTLVYRACNYLSTYKFLKDEVENRDSVSRAIEKVIKKFPILTKRIITDMVLSDKDLCKKTTLDLVPYHNVYKNRLRLTSIPDLMSEFHIFCKGKKGFEMDCSGSSVVTKESPEIIDCEIHNVLNDIKNFTEHKEEQDKASFSLEFSKAFKVPPQKFLDCMFSENKKIVISELSEDMFELISSSSLSLLCQVMKNAVSSMHRDFRTKLMIKDFIKGTNFLSGL